MSPFSQLVVFELFLLALKLCNWMLFAGLDFGFTEWGCFTMRSWPGAKTNDNV